MGSEWIVKTLRMLRISAYFGCGFEGDSKDAKGILYYIAALESENERLKEDRRWIPVSERLPEENQQILSTDGKEFYLDYYARWEGKDNPPCFCDGLSWAVTHWMRLPEPPEVEE